MSWIAPSLLTVALVAALTSASKPDGHSLSIPEDRIMARYAALKPMGALPLPLRVAREEDWPAIRRRVADDPALTAWVKGRGQVVDQAMQWRDEPRLIAGWTHDLVDPRTKAPLSMQGMAEPAVTPERRKLHGAWVAYRRIDAINKMNEAARLFRLRDEDRYAIWAAEKMDFYAANYTRWPVQSFSGSSRMLGQSLDEAAVAFRLIDTARLLKGRTDAKRWAAWNSGLFLPLYQQLGAARAQPNNIGVWIAAARAAIALHLGRTDLYEDAVHGANGLAGLIDAGVLDDYEWYEPSVSYHSYTVRALAELFTAASLRGEFGTLRPLMLVAQNMAASIVDLAYADSTLPAIGDGAPGSPAFSAGLASLVKRTMPLRIGDGPHNWDRLIDPVSLPEPPTRNMAPLTVRRGWQIAMLRQAGWEGVMTYGQPFASHAHANALSYELRYRGATVSGPAGLAPYGSSLFLDYVRQAAAGNMAFIDGASQRKPGPGTLESADGSRLSASFSPIGTGGTFRRVLSIQNGGFVEETVVRAGYGGANHRLGTLFHTPCAIDLAAPLTPAQQPPNDGFSFFNDIRATRPLKIVEGRLRCGTVRFDLRITADRPGRLFVMKDPSLDGQPLSRSLYFEVEGNVLTIQIRLTPSG